MKKFCFNDLDGTIIITDKEIIEQYYEYWKKRMTQVGKEHLISEKHCIEDFVTVHWAWEIKEDAKSS